MNQYENMKSNSRSFPASFRTLTIWRYKHIIALIISVSDLYTLYGLRGSVGVLCVHRCKYSHLIAFNLHAWNSANTPGHPDRSAGQTPGQVRPDSIVGAWWKIRTPKRRSIISGICAICQRSATDQRKESARARTGPGVHRPRSADKQRSEKQALKLWNREISDQNLWKIFLIVVGILRKHRGVQNLLGQNLENQKFFEKILKIIFL